MEHYTWYVTSHAYPPDSCFRLQVALQYPTAWPMMIAINMELPSDLLKTTLRLD